MFNKVLIWAGKYLSVLKPYFIKWLEKALKQKAFELAAKTFLKSIIKTAIGGWLFMKVLEELLEEADPYIDGAFRRIKKVKRVAEGKEKLEELGEINENGTLDDWRNAAGKL